MSEKCENIHEVEFIEEKGGYVIIRYNNIYIGISVDNLKIDPFAEYLGDCFLAPRILTACELSILYQRIGDSLSFKLKSKKGEDDSSCRS